jgi:hypothetical protein
VPGPGTTVNSGETKSTLPEGSTTTGLRGSTTSSSVGDTSTVTTLDETGGPRFDTTEETTATSSPQGDSDADGDVTTATQDDSTGGYLTTMVGDSDGSSPTMATDDSSTMSKNGTDPTTTASEGGDATTMTTDEEPDGGVTLDPFTTETDSGTGLSCSTITRNEWSPSCSSSECCSCRRLSLAAVARIEIVPAA